ncbi:MAG: thermonuclease family protein, partial [Hyphomicrobiales bacterium]|nr:thermonuclease family protein [Hyphomicrobiales bacterium]
MAAFMALTLSAPTAALEVTGIARVVDGDTLNLEGLGVRLHGIDAPETAQRCTDAQGRDYACG